MGRVVLFFLFLPFIITSCSEDRIEYISGEELGTQEGETSSLEFVKGNKNLTSNFLPTFTNFYGRDRGTSTNRSSSLASEWIHEYDESEKLVKSFFYELFPYRLLREVTYLDFVEDHKLKYEIKEYGYYGLLYSFVDSYELTFNDNMVIERIDDGTVFKELNDLGWVTKINTVTPDGHIIYKRGYEYDDTGNVLKYLAYDNPGVASSTVDYTYNENGDPLSYHFQNTAGAETKVKYYYRQDNTLEKLEEEYKNDNDDFGTEIYTYNLEERLLKQITNKGDGSKKLVTYTEDQVVVENFDIDGLLREIFLYQIQEESYYLKLHKEYLNGVIHKIKYYNSDGELDYTEYYDENGNLTETVHE